MTSTPLAVVGCGFSNEDANDIVSAHVLAMFIPSFFTGHLIVRFGVLKIMTAGLLILGLGRRRRAHRCDARELLRRPDSSGGRLELRVRGRDQPFGHSP